MYVTKTVQIFVKDLWLAAVKTVDFKRRSQQHQNKNMFFDSGHLIILKNSIKAFLLVWKCR